VPVVSSQGIFMSYRRADAAAYARLLQHALRDRIPDAHVFMDLDSIEAGVNFAHVIREAIDSCAVLVAVIGCQWATLTDGRVGARGVRVIRRWSMAPDRLSRNICPPICTNSQRSMLSK
jgi:hypothetical protein